MSNELTREEKVLLVESKIRTCTTMQESMETYALEETDLEIAQEYRDKVEDYKNIINVLKVFKETCQNSTQYGSKCYTIQRYKDAKWTQGDTMADYDLTAEEKISVINTHIKNINYNKFNAELVIIEENATAEPSAIKISDANATIAESDAQIIALEAQIEALS